MKNLFGRILPTISICILFAIAGFAQDLDKVTISGKIVDSNNQAIVGATVTATVVTTGAERSVTTDDNGRYQIVQLEPGLYKVSAVAGGFGLKEKTDLQTIAAQNVQLDFQLAPADVKAETTVEASDDAVAVDTTRTIVGGTITEREIEELPNNTRNPLDLVFTLGGVTEEPLSTRDLAEDSGTRGATTPGTTPEEAGTFALSGGAAYSNNITIDGLDNNDDRTASFRYQPSLESISEVQVITNQFSAEYGRASGGRVNIRTRGGSNRFRGRAYFFFRDDSLNANTWNNNRRGVPRPPFTNYDPGATFGGPIVKNKLFFFSSYEFDKILDNTIVDVFVPVSNTSSFTNLPTPTNPTQRVCSSSNTVLVGGIPTSVCDVAGQQAVYVAPYIQPFETPRVNHRFNTRIDWNFNQKNNFTFGFQLGRLNDKRQFSGTNRLADSLIGRVRNSEAYNATYNFFPTSKIVNQFRFQYSRLRPNATPNSGADAPVILISFTPPGENSSTQIYSASTSGSSDRKEDRFQFQDTFTYIIGDHNLKFGADYQRVNSEYIDRFDATGTYRFSNFYFFGINSVSSFQQNFNTQSKVTNNYDGIFVQDDWRIRPNVTFSYGLRYERESVIKDNNNFGPRVAVAWNPFPKGSKTVVRVGAGIFYNRALLRTVDDFTAGSQELRFDSRNPIGAGIANFDFNLVRNFLSSQFPNKLTLDTAVPVSATETRTIRQLSKQNTFRSLDPNLNIPESYQFNVGFERELFKGIVFESNFTVNKTVGLWRDVNINAPVVPAGTPDRDGNGSINLTDYLLGFSGVLNPSTNATVRFVLGNPEYNNSVVTANGVTTVNLNTLNNSNLTSSANGAPTSAIAYALAAVANLRPLFSQGIAVEQERIFSTGRSFYKGVTFELRNRYRNFGHGFGGSMRLVYTLSSLKDDGIVNTSSAQINGDFNSDYSRSLLDRRHRIAFSGTFDLPKYLGKLRLSPLFRYGSSSPFNISAGGVDRNLDDVSNDRPNFSGDLKSLVSRQYGSPFPTQLAGQFSLAPIGSPGGNLPRNAGKGPSQYIFDLNVSREFKLTERFKLRPTIELDNVFNMTVFSFGSNFINFDLLNSTNALTVSNAQANFLAPTRTLRPRQIRLGIRFDF